jgi:hypothetical protein
LDSAARFIIDRIYQPPYSENEAGAYLGAAGVGAVGESGGSGAAAVRLGREDLSLLKEKASLKINVSTIVFLTLFVSAKAVESGIWTPRLQM